MSTPTVHGGLALISAALLSSVLGSVHAFSVFLEPLEAQFGATRAMVSLTYSFALIALTAAVLSGGVIFARWRPGPFLAGVGLIAALGALIAAAAPSLGVVWLGYSLLFGAANGLGYGYGLQIAAQANPGREGWAMGVVTAAYALGAALAPFGFVALTMAGGFAAAMTALAVVVAATAMVSALLMARSGAVFQAPTPGATRTTIGMRSFVTLWIGYGASVAGGLMAIGHAAGVASSLGYQGPDWAAPSVIAVANLIGSLVGGRLVDLMRPLNLLSILPGMAAVALAAMALGGGAGMLFLFAVIGFTYGGVIAAYPAAILKAVGPAQSQIVYGKVFTAWGAAGLAAPWLAGALFDVTDGYVAALLVAAALAGLSALFARVGPFAER
ncbi:MAG: MFS transporter [Pseudomonadota bacterium]